MWCVLHSSHSFNLLLHFCVLGQLIRAHVLFVLSNAKEYFFFLFVINETLLVILPDKVLSHQFIVLVAARSFDAAGIAGIVEFMLFEVYLTLLVSERILHQIDRDFQR